MPEKCFYDISNVKKQDMDEYPEFFARFYDVIYKEIREGTDTEFYLNKILGCKGRILEVGTGTGRFFIEALEKGADIYGIDVSKSMIDVLRSKIPEKHHNRVFVKDIRDMNLGMKFDLIVAPFRVFQHIADTDDQIAALNNIRKHLNNDCEFIFDVFVPNLNILLNETLRAPVFEGEYEKGRKIEVFVSSKTDIINQMMNVIWTLEWDENGTKTIREWNTNIRYFFRYELENLMRLSKLRLVKMHGDFNEGPLNNDSQDFVLICKNDPLKT